VPLISYAQNFEDVLLWRALDGIPQGLYIDVGAQDPTIDSVSRAFYEHGWRGIHVDANASYCDLLRRDRPDEQVIQAAMGAEPGLLTFYEFPGTGLSTALESIADQHREAGWPVTITQVPCLTLDALFDSIGPKEVHWLKIDVEGYERFVIEGWRNSPTRPWIILVEAVAPFGAHPTHETFEPALCAKGYHCVHFDGLNRYYVSDDHTDLDRHFQFGPSLWDEIQIPQESRLAQHLLEQHRHQTAVLQQENAAQNERLAQQHEREIEQLRTELNGAVERHDAARKQFDRIIEQFERTSMRLDEQIVAQSRRIQRLAGYLDTISSSLWWRVTKPFRSLSLALVTDMANLEVVGGPRAQSRNGTGARSVDELILRGDRDFVEFAFLTLLGRPVDDDGLRHYLGLLAGGRSRERIICDLRSSPEGRAFAADTPGLTRLMQRQQLLSIPVIGQILRAVGLRLIYRPSFWFGTANIGTALPDKDVRRLLRRRGEDFLRAAYSAILGRLPDPDGEQHFMRRLEQGDERLDILALLRWSLEGRSCGALTHELAMATNWYRWRRIWPIGPLLHRRALRRYMPLAPQRLATIVAELDHLEEIQETAPLCVGDAALREQGHSVPTPPDAPPASAEEGWASDYSRTACCHPVDIEWQGNGSENDSARAAAAALRDNLPERSGDGLDEQALCIVCSSGVPESTAPGMPSIWYSVNGGEIHLAPFHQFPASVVAIACRTSFGARQVVNQGHGLIAVPVGGGGSEQGARQVERVAGDAAKKILLAPGAYAPFQIDAVIDAFERSFSSSDLITLVVPVDEELRVRWESCINARRSQSSWARFRLINVNASDTTLDIQLRSADFLLINGYQSSEIDLVCEAYAAGLGVIANPFGLLGDLCDSSNSWTFAQCPATPSTEGPASGMVVDDCKANASSLSEALVAATQAQPDVVASKATAGRQKAEQLYAWINAADRMADLLHRLTSTASIRQEIASRGRLRVAMLTTWNVRCGIATHSAELAGAFEDADVRIYAADKFPRLGEDGPEVNRLWYDGKGGNRLFAVIDHLRTSPVDLLLIQFNYGFFEHQALVEFIEAATDLGIVVMIILHSTVDPLGDTPNWRVAELLPGLHRCGRVIVHAPGDVSRLAALGLSDNVLLLPHGVVVGDVEHQQGIHGDVPVLSVFGFCLPNKGLVELVQTVGILRDRGVRLRLTMLNAIHPHPSSAATMRAIREAITTLGLSSVIEFIPDYLDLDTVDKMIAQTDLFVNPYRQTGESASGAVRIGLRTGRPTIVTPLPIFDDLGAAVFRMPGTTPEEMANGIATALRYIIDGTEEAQRVASALEEWLALHDFRQQTRQLSNIYRSLRLLDVIKNWELSCEQ